MGVAVVSVEKGAKAKKVEEGRYGVSGVQQRGNAGQVVIGGK